MSFIENIIAREILDSRGNPTIEVDVIASTGHVGRAAVPSGASTGEFEAVELRDKDAERYGGKGVLKAIEHIHDIIEPELYGCDLREQFWIDERLVSLDGSSNKSNLGANAILGVSLACAKAAAKSMGMPLYRYIGGISARVLPIPMMNILNGGSHANNSIDIQEFMIFPHNTEIFSESLQMGVEVFHSLKSILFSRGLTTSVGDEGGFAPNLPTNESAVEIILEAIEKAGYIPGEDILIAIDAAASEFYIPDENRYHLAKSTGDKLTSEDMINLWEDWCKKYPIFSIEDGLNENDWDGWKKMTEKIGTDIQLVGDDLFVTHTERLAKGIQEGVANSILIKPNQIGTLSETIEAVDMAHVSGYSTVMSHRSGETEDHTIADLAVGLGCGQIKAGSASRSDRTAKYNQLLRIEEDLEGAGILGR